VEGICGWTDDILGGLSKRRGVRRTDQVGVVEDELRHYVGLARRVLWQTRQRILEGAAVPSDQKVYSIHESHTELLIRGKAGKHIEYGHMIGIQQVAEKFITDFEVFEQKPVEYELLEPALESHRRLFGAFPDGVTGDKAYWEGPAAYAVLSEKVPNLSIAKKGSRTKAEDEREHSDWFSALQAFRAGIEGTISCLKRGFRLARCLNKGWRGHGATVGMSIVAHNLLLLAKLSC
jgi:IS5 family transposase